MLNLTTVHTCSYFVDEIMDSGSIFGITAIVGIAAIVGMLTYFIALKSAITRCLGGSGL